MEVKREDSVGDEEAVNGTGKGLNAYINGERSSEETASGPSSSDNTKDKNTINHELDKLESMKAEMGEVKEENERLKTIMARIAKDYQSLQMHFFAIVHERQQAKKPVETITSPPPRQEISETELVSLSLGTIASGQKKEEIKASKSPRTRKKDEQMKELNLGLDCSRFDRSGNGGNEVNYSPNLSPEHGFVETKQEEEEAGDQPRQQASKVLKSLRNGDDEATEQTRVVKRARVSVRARCDAPTMNDGCQWRKYGQKIAKGNPCPRAYYRCTVAPACPVRKQVQRCADDMSILITTYEGTHNHPLPVSATAMASTTSAAACMLMSGSSSTSQPAINEAPTRPGATGNIGSFHVLNSSSHYLDYSRPRQFYIPNPSISPTITLDLTSPPVCSSSSSTQFNKLSTNFSSSAPSYSSTSLNFSEPKSSPASWSNGYNLSYGSQAYNSVRNMATSEGQMSSQIVHSYHKRPIGSFNLGRQSQEPVYQSYMQRLIDSIPPAPIQNSLTDTIAAATKAITSDPSFQSALAAAITSIVGEQGTQSI